MGDRGDGGMVFGTRNFSDRSSGSRRSAEHEVGADQKGTPDTPHPPAEVEVTGSALSLGSRTSRLASELLRLTWALGEGSEQHPRALHADDGDDRDDGNDSSVGNACDDGKRNKFSASREREASSLPWGASQEQRRKGTVPRRRKLQDETRQDDA